MSPFPDFSARLLAAAAAELGGKVYGHSGAATTDCSRAVEGILIRLYGPISHDDHAALMIFDPSQPFSPIDVVERLSIGERVDTVQAGRWHVVQGWRVLDSNGHVPNPSPSPNGHAFLWYEPESPIPARGLRVEANVRRPWVYPQTWAEAVKPYRAGVEVAALVAS